MKGISFVIFFLILILYIFISGLNNDPKLIPSALINKPVPDFQIEKVNTRINSFSKNDIMNFKGVKLVNIFASWCLPCRVEHPQLKEISKKKIPIYGINKKDKVNDLEAWLAELGNPFHAIGSDSNGKASIQWGVYGIPETFILDKKSNIRYKHVGPILHKDLEKIYVIIESLKDE